MARCAILLPILMLLACGAEPIEQPPSPRDPQVAQALDDPLMTDPDLSSRNEGAAALTVELDGALPVLPVTDEAIEAARAEAAKLAGGSARMANAPPPRGQAPVPSDSSPEGHLALLPGGAPCSGMLRASAIWAARLPPALPVYPRGATTAAAGSDVAGCQARVIAFTTPVPLDEVLAFYWTGAHAAGLAPRHRNSPAGQVLWGGKGGFAFDLRGTREGDQTIVRLVTLQR
jgi:hypothetical protein